MSRIDKKNQISSSYLALGIFLISLLALQCGHQKGGERKVLVATDIETEESKETGAVDPDTKSASRPPDDLLERIQTDEIRSADIIRDSLLKQDSTLSAWAAVYALRLGIEHDEKFSKKAIEGVAKLDDPLLVALCFRWLAKKKGFRVPGRPKVKDMDPVVQAMAALAVASRRAFKKDLSRALGLPNIDLPKDDPDRRKETKERVEKLLALTAPYDDGPLALAVAFVEARRQEWIESDDNGNPKWTARRLRSELGKVVLGDDTKARMRIENSKPARGDGFTQFSERLEPSLLGHSRDMLHSIIVTGQADLQIDALNALSVLAFEPTAADFGAAAAVLDSKSPLVRLVGAHTFLFLSRRARSTP